MRFCKSVSLIKGVNLNLGKKGASVSVGPKGLKTTVGTSGRVTSTIGIPGTGVSYNKSSKIPSSTLEPHCVSPKQNTFCGNLSTAKFCIHCGKKRSLLESFSKYGFCQKCNTELHSLINQKLDSVKRAIELFNPSDCEAEHVLSHFTVVSLALETIDELEVLRQSAPFFKSSTDEYRAVLEQYNAIYKKECSDVVL